MRPSLPHGVSATTARSPGRYADDSRIDFAVGQRHVEHVDLVVVRGDAAVGGDEIRAVRDALAIGLQRERAHEQPHRKLARERLKLGQRGRAVRLERTLAHDAPAAVHHQRVFGRHHEAARRCCAASRAIAFTPRDWPRDRCPSASAAGRREIGMSWHTYAAISACDSAFVRGAIVPLAMSFGASAFGKLNSSTVPTGSFRKIW